MGVATSDGTAGTRAALQSLKIDRYLPHVFGYDSVARPKPAPDMVFAFAAAIGAEPEAIVVIGDNTHDLEMARSAGAGAALGVLSGTGTLEALAPLADRCSTACATCRLGSDRGTDEGGSIRAQATLPIRCSCAATRSKTRSRGTGGLNR